MNPNGKALLILDVQNDFIEDTARMPVDKKQGEKMIANLNKLLDSSKAKSLTIVYIGNEYGRFDPSNIFRNFAALKNTDGARLSDKLHVVSKNYFSKSKANAFSNPALKVFLKAENIKEVYFCGLYAEACVYATAKHATKSQYTTFAVIDCIASKSDLKLLKMTARYQKIGVRTITSDAFMSIP